MDQRYRDYNEMLFEAYCKASIDHAIWRGLKRKRELAKHEVPMSDIPDSLFTAPGPDQEQPAFEPTPFTVNDQTVTVEDIELAQALRHLTPQRRDILLLAYYLGASDSQIGAEMNLPKDTVRYRRLSALDRMRELLGGQR